MLITGDLGFCVFDEYRERFPRPIHQRWRRRAKHGGARHRPRARRSHSFTSTRSPTSSSCAALEQIRNDASYHDCNVNVVCVGGGFSYGALGISHHATEDLAIMRSLPNVKVLSPCDHWEAAEATEAIANTPGVYLLCASINRLLRPPTARAKRFNSAKSAACVKGTDVTLAATGGILAEAMAAAEELATQGIQARVLSVHTLKPLDVGFCIKRLQGMYT